MKNLITGLFFVFVVLGAAVLQTKAQLTYFINVEGLLVVVGGTFTILVLNSRFHDLKILARKFFSLLKVDDRKVQLKATLLSCTQKIEKGQMPAATGDEWIDRSLEWIATGLRGNDLESLLNDRQNIQLDQLYRCASILQNLSKYPPALGMIGTVVGIISIFQGLGQDAGQAALGQNLAIAMSSTLYGLVLANFFINPIAELLVQSIQKREEELNLINETAKMWAQKENSIYIKEHIELHDVA